MFSGFKVWSEKAYQDSTKGLYGFGGLKVLGFGVKFGNLGG